MGVGKTSPPLMPNDSNSSSPKEVSFATNNIVVNN